MFGFTLKLPITEDDRQWVDEGFRRLEKSLGRHRLLGAKVVERRIPANSNSRLTKSKSSDRVAP
jgi:hypothetical protein